MIIDGKKIAGQILEKLKEEVAQLPFQPIFCDVLVGNDPASVQYVDMKAKRAESVGFKVIRADFGENISTEELVSEIKKLNQEPHMCGLIVQLPLPKHIDKQAVLNAIDPRIDIDCIGSVNTDLLYQGKAYLEPPTASAICELLNHTDVNIKDKRFLVIGQGDLVGKPTTFLLKQKGYTVQTADIETKNLSELTRSADVIISATGNAKLITKDMVKDGAIVIDAGTSESGSGIVGDADFESVKDVASFISPVPGGVGPVTIAKLLWNVFLVARL